MASCSNCRYPCLAGKMGAAGCCERHWRKELVDTHDLPESIRKCLLSLPLEVREQVFPLYNWQQLRYFEREYGFQLEIAHGDESKVKKEKEDMIECIQSIIQKVVGRCEAIRDGVKEPEPPAHATTPNYTEARYGKDL